MLAVAPLGQFAKDITIDGTVWNRSARMLKHECGTNTLCDTVQQMITCIYMYVRIYMSTYTIYLYSTIYARLVHQHMWSTDAIAVNSTSAYAYDPAVWHKVVFLHDADRQHLCEPTSC